MITRIEALNFRSLRHVSQPLGRFQVQVGPNASGKTTFQDIIRFLGVLVDKGLEATLKDFSLGTVRDLFWNHQGRSFELAVEWEIPQTLQAPMQARKWDIIRYEIEVGVEEGSDRAKILQERGLLKQRTSDTPALLLFPIPLPGVSSLISAQAARGERKVFGKSKTGNDVFNSEVTKEGGKGWVLTLKLGSNRSALAGLPEDTAKFPVSTWFRKTLLEGIQRIVLDSQQMRRMSPPALETGPRFRPDGSNLPWLLDEFKKADPERFAKWVGHVRTALPDIRDVLVKEREDIRHKYLVVEYAGGPQVPSWLVSDGTLRLLALTLPAYLPGMQGVFLMEEPENGLHPKAIETVIKSLKSVYDAQVLVATHSPVVISTCESADILCFAKQQNATAIVRGDRHPALEEWRGSPDLSVMFASGILG